MVEYLLLLCDALAERGFSEGRFTTVFFKGFRL